MTTSQKSISSEGLRFIKKKEGLKLEAYQDVAGVWTIGYGHTGDVKPGMTITSHQADAILDADVDRFERAVNNLVKVEINQGQFDALVSFAFNVGDAALARSNLLRLVNEKKFEEAAREFSKWKYAGGQIDNGLATRREDEAALFRTGVV